MFCRSLRHAGEELLGGVAGYPDFPWTSGIALLHPWANRLGEFRYDGVTLDPDSPDLYVLDGVALHGLRSAVTGWEVVESSDTRLVAGRELDLREFPFPHRSRSPRSSPSARSTLTTTVTAHDRPVPIAFGYHPYFSSSATGRSSCRWPSGSPSTNVRSRPASASPPATSTGRSARARSTTASRSRRTPARSCWPAAGAGSRSRSSAAIAYAQIFAPSISDVICFEPMTAPTDALRHSPGTVAPGESYSARFSVSVSRAG